MSQNFRSKLSRAKGLGAAHHGVSHWWAQRVTAVALIPLSVWFAISLVTCLLSPDVLRVAEWFSSPFNTVFMILFIGAAFYHARLGIQVVIEDYVKGPFAKYGMLLFLDFLCYGIAAAGILAALKLHFLDAASSM